MDGFVPLMDLSWQEELDRWGITWRLLLEKKFIETKDSFDNVVSIVRDIDKKFIDSSVMGGIDSEKSFAVWTNDNDYVYFPLFYDGATWVGYVSRNPDGKPVPPLGRG